MDQSTPVHDIAPQGRASGDISLSQRDYGDAGDRQKHRQRVCHCSGRKPLRIEPQQRQGHIRTRAVCRSVCEELELEYFRRARLHNGVAGLRKRQIRCLRGQCRAPQRTSVQQLFLSNAYTAGIWGREGPVIGGNGKLYGGTADGDTDPSKGDYSLTVVAVNLADLSVADYFLPANSAYLKKMDFDLGSASPVWFKWQNRSLVAHGSKEGVVYLLDADRLGAADHGTPLFKSPRLGNDQEQCCDGSGIWGGLSYSRDNAGQAWLYVPMGGSPSAQAPRFPITNGDNPHGSIMAFKVVGDPKTHEPVLEPAWISGDFQYPDPAVIANGVLFALSNGENPDQRGDESRRFLNTRPEVLKALDAKTGKELYNSGDAMTAWAHFSGLAVADGRIYAVDHDSNVYCFGLAGSSSVTRIQNSPSNGGQDQLSTSWIGRAERQDEFLSSWIKRAGGAAALVVLAAIAGIWAALKDERKTEQS